MKNGVFEMPIQKIQKQEKTITIDGQPIKNFQEFSDGNNKYYIFVYAGVKIVFAPHGIFPSHKILDGADTYVGSAFSENDKVCVINQKSHLFFGKNNQSSEILKIAPQIEIVWIDLKGNNIASLAKSDDVFKAKIYLKPQEKPPKGLEVKRGPRGGLYYESKISIAKPTISDIDKNLLLDSRLFVAKLSHRDAYQVAQDILLDDIQSKENFTEETLEKAKETLRIWDAVGYMNHNTAPIWQASFLETGHSGFPPDIKKAIENEETDLDEVNFFRHLIRKTKNLLTQKYKGAITLYRGLDQDSKKFIDKVSLPGEKFKIKTRALESWTDSKSVARTYAGSKGLVLKTEVRPDQVGYFGGFCLPKVTSTSCMEFSLNLTDDFQIVENVTEK